MEVAQEINGNHQQGDVSKTSQLLKADPPGVDAERGVEEGPSLTEKIIKQVEFYLSDENLVHDKFLQELLLKDETGQGNVSIKELARFPKMKQLTKDTTVVREALKKSPNLQVSTNGAMVKRKIPYQGPFMVGDVVEFKNDEKTMIYVSNIPKEFDRDAVFLLFSAYGTVRRLDIPLDKKTGEKRGIAFVQYENPQQVQKALNDFSRSSPSQKIKVSPYKDLKKSDTKEAATTGKGVKEPPKAPKEPKEPPKAPKEQKEPKQPRNKAPPKEETEVDVERKRSRPGFLTDAFNDYKEKASQRQQNRSNSLTKNQVPADWEADPSTADLRPKLSHKGIVAEPSISPMRQPIGPSQMKGFPVGRGKPILC